VVRSSTNSILTKMGLVGIKLKISLKEETHLDFDFSPEVQPKVETQTGIESESKRQTENQRVPSDSGVKTESKDIINSQVKEIAVNKSET